MKWNQYKQNTFNNVAAIQSLQDILLNQDNFDVSNSTVKISFKKNIKNIQNDIQNIPKIVADKIEEDFKNLLRVHIEKIEPKDIEIAEEPEPEVEQLYSGPPILDPIDESSAQNGRL
jgi:hypothetical protein